MALSKWSQTWKKYYHLTLLLFILGVGSLVALYAYRYYLQRETTILDTAITEKQSQIDKLLSEEDFQHYLQIQALEAKTQSIPWSDYVNRILNILETLKSVEESRGGVHLSDFKVDLEQLSLNGVVSNLKVLYGNRLGSGGLIDNFNQLDFLSNITIKKYEKSEEDGMFTFTLSANVISNGSTGSTTHQ